jgi:hypothetical protein
MWTDISEERITEQESSVQQITTQNYRCENLKSYREQLIFLKREIEMAFNTADVILLEGKFKKKV